MKTLLPLITLLGVSLTLGETAQANGYYYTPYGDPGCQSLTAQDTRLTYLTWTPFQEQRLVRAQYQDPSSAWMLQNAQLTGPTPELAYPQTASQGLYAMALDAQRRGASAYADVLRRLTIANMDHEQRMVGLEASMKAQTQISERVAVKQEKIRKGYAELQPQYDELMRRRRDLRGQDAIHQYNIEAASYTARLRQLRRDEAEVGMMMRSGPRF